MPRLIFQVNVSRSDGNQYVANGGSAPTCLRIQNDLSGQFNITAGPSGQKLDIDGGFLLPDRSEIDIAMILTPKRGGPLTDSDYYTITVVTFNAMKTTARTGWSVEGMMRGLHTPTDSFNLSLGLLNPNGISRISRTVDSIPTIGAGFVGAHPVTDAIVRDSTLGGVGGTIPSTANNALDRAKQQGENLFNEYRVPIYIGTGLLGVVAIAYVVRTFK